MFKTAGLAGMALKGVGKYLGMALKPMTWQSKFNPVRIRTYGALANKKLPGVGDVLTDLFMLPLSTRLVSGLATAPAWMSQAYLKKQYGTAPVPMTGLFTK